MYSSLLSVFLSSYVQGSAKEWSLGCVKRAPGVRGGQDAGTTQPGAHSLADPCTLRNLSVHVFWHLQSVLDNRCQLLCRARDNQSSLFHPPFPLFSFLIHKQARGNLLRCRNVTRMGKGEGGRGKGGRAFYFAIEHPTIHADFL